MIAWLIQNLATILITLGLLALVGGIVFSLIKNKKKGRSSCGCGCSSCPMGGSCHKP